MLSCLKVECILRGARSLVSEGKGMQTALIRTLQLFSSASSLRMCRLDLESSLESGSSTPFCQLGFLAAANRDTPFLE